MTAGAPGGGDGGDREHWARMRAALADLERSVASDLGNAEVTAQAREYIEHNEPGLALELLVSIAARAGLDPAGFADGVEEAVARMGLSDSEDVAAWRKRRGRGAA